MEGNCASEAVFVRWRSFVVFCVATLICDKYVVTAAHCMQYVTGPETLQIYLMEQDFEVENENAQPTLKIDVEKLILHHQYNRRPINNDITLLKLKTPVNITDGSSVKMSPACLPSNNAVNFAGEEAIVAGWGATSFGATVVSKLQQLKVPILDQKVCQTKTKYKDLITENMLCAGFLEGGKDACGGDSGGPLVVKQKERFVLAGLISFGYDCAKPGAPGVYTRLGRYTRWIRDKTKDCSFCKQ